MCVDRLSCFVLAYVSVQRNLDITTTEQQKKNILEGVRVRIFSAGRPIRCSLCKSLGNRPGSNCNVAPLPRPLDHQHHHQHHHSEQQSPSTTCRFRTCPFARPLFHLLPASVVNNRPLVTLLASPTHRSTDSLHAETTLLLACQLSLVRLLNLPLPRLHRSPRLSLSCRPRFRCQHPQAPVLRESQPPTPFSLARTTPPPPHARQPFSVPFALTRFPSTTSLRISSFPAWTTWKPL